MQHNWTFRVPSWLSDREAALYEFLGETMFNSLIRECDELPEEKQKHIRENWEKFNEITASSLEAWAILTVREDMEEGMELAGKSMEELEEFCNELVKAAYFIGKCAVSYYFDRINEPQLQNCNIDSHGPH